MTNIDRETIQMCDVPEIQDRWEPKVGDRVWNMQGQWDGVVIEITSGAIEVLTGTCQIWLYDKPIYIPRIEDVLEWLVPKHFGGWDSAHERVTEMYYSYNMAIKGWLAMAMHLEHSKAWSGERWIKN
jgi:hypothetical protein